MFTNDFGITDIAHPGARDWKPNCPECLALTESAVVHAQATGSRGATYSTGDHSVTVARLLGVFNVDEWAKS